MREGQTALPMTLSAVAFPDEAGDRRLVRAVLVARADHRLVPGTDPAAWVDACREGLRRGGPAGEYEGIGKAVVLWLFDS